MENDRSFLASVRLAELSGIKLQGLDPLVLHCARQISRFNKFRLDPFVLAQPSRLPESTREVTPRLGYNGEDLAGTLYHLSETGDPSLEVIKQRMIKVEPAFDDFEFSSVGADRIAFALKYTDARSSVPSVRLSSGTAIYLGLITLVSISNRPPLLMIEEAENGLTPQAITSLYEAVRSLALQDAPGRRSQILLSSHSPFVICDAWNGDDRDFIHQVKVEDGASKVSQFADVVKRLGIQLSKDQGERRILSINNAAAIMSGYLS